MKLSPSLAGAWVDGAGGSAEGTRPAARPGLSSGHISPRSGRLIWAENGRYVRVKFSGAPSPKQERDRRGAISGFTWRSRNRLLIMLNSIDQAKLDPTKVRFVTLTYPLEFPTARASKRDLDSIVKRYERAFGRTSIIWKIEPQKRGAPHYHLMLFGDLKPDLDAERVWWANNWYEVVESGDKKHLLAGTSLEIVRQWQGVVSYASKKYMGKVVVGSEGDWKHAGRYWGVRRRDLLPIVILEHDLPEAQAVVVARTIRRWIERQPTDRFYLPGIRESSGKHLPGQILRRDEILSPVRNNFGGTATFADASTTLERVFNRPLRPLRRRWPRRKNCPGVWAFISATTLERLICYVEITT